MPIVGFGSWKGTMAAFTRRERVSQFKQSVSLNFKGTRFEGRAPQAFRQGDAVGTIDTTLEEMEQAWSDINTAVDIPTFNAPLVLPGGYGARAFATERAAFLAQGKVAFDAELEASQRRANRDVLLPPQRERMRQYRLAAPLALPKNSPLLATIPRLSPAAGTTPTSLVVTGNWNSTSNLAELSWPTFAGKDGLKLQVRACTGGSWKSGEEEVVADLDIAATSWSGDWGLTAPGAIATFKVFVLTTTGNENGGKAVKVVRPV